MTETVVGKSHLEIWFGDMRINRIPVRVIEQDGVKVPQMWWNGSPNQYWGEPFDREGPYILETIELGLSVRRTQAMEGWIETEEGFVKETV